MTTPALADAPETSARGASPSGLRRLPFEPPCLLAPMEGLTLAPFRAVVAAHGGLGAVVTEFVDEGKAISARGARKHVVRCGVPLVVQLLGKDPVRLAEATGRLVDAGAEGIDLNVGCPSSCVTKGDRGAALLKDPDRLHVLLSAMVRAAGGRVPVSAKVRAGWDDTGGLPRIAEAVEGAGAAYMTVHGRTFAQGYAGKASLDLIASARALVRIPVVANGDIVRAREAQAILAQGLADGVMIGRGAVKNPWIFAQLEALRSGGTPETPTARDLRALLGRHAEAFQAEFGPGRERAVLAKMKEIAAFMGQGIEDGGAFRADTRRAQSLEEFFALAEARLAPLGEQALGLGA